MDEPLLFQDNDLNLEDQLLHHPPFQRPTSPVRNQDSYFQEVAEEEDNNYMF